MEAGCWCWCSAAQDHGAFWGSGLGPPNCAQRWGKEAAGSPATSSSPCPIASLVLCSLLGCRGPRSNSLAVPQFPQLPRGSTTRAECPHFRGIPRGALSPLSDTISHIPACCPVLHSPTSSPRCQGRAPHASCSQLGLPTFTSSNKGSVSSTPPHPPAPPLPFLSGSFFSLSLFIFFFLEK